MTENDDTKSQKGIPDSGESQSIPSIQKDESISEKKDDSQKGESNESIQAKPKKFIIYRYWGKFKNWSRPDKIATLGIITVTIINGILAVLTFKVLWQNSNQFEIVNRPNLNIGWVHYVFKGEGSVPMHSGKERIIRFCINNLGTHPVHVYGFKACFIFDTSKVKVNSLIDRMKSDSFLRAWNVIVPVLTPAYDTTYYRDCVFASNPSSEDSAKIQNGVITFYLEIEYANEFSKCWGTYVALMTLKDHHSPETLIHTLYYNENLDSAIKRPMPFLR